MNIDFSVTLITISNTPAHRKNSLELYPITNSLILSSAGSPAKSIEERVNTETGRGSIKDNMIFDVLVPTRRNVFFMISHGDFVMYQQITKQEYKSTSEN